MGDKRGRIESIGVEAALVRADCFEQFLEVGGVDLAPGMLEPVVVGHESVDEILVQTIRGPLAELRNAWTAHAIADGEDGGQAVAPDFSTDRAGTLWANHSEFANICPGVHFAREKNAPQLFDSSGRCDLEQFGYGPQGQPKTPMLEAALDASLTVFGLVANEAGLRWLVLGHGQLLGFSVQA